MTHDVNANDVVAFFVEVAAFILLGIWAWRLAPANVPARLLSVTLVVGMAGLLWALFAAPEAAVQVLPLAIAVKVLVLGGSVLAAYTMLSGGLLVSWAAVVLANTMLVFVGPFAR